MRSRRTASDPARAAPRRVTGRFVEVSAPDNVVRAEPRVTVLELPDAAIRSLVNGLNDTAPAAGWRYIDTGTIGGDAIRVALIYRDSTVAPLGSRAILDSRVDARFDDSRNRPVLAQSFRERSSGAVFTLAVNHLKSKGS
ncbi:MAG: hypothetical protein U5K76_01435 [Woeseiaceae bacterium]|nr:hypothetical protein [Woeseiaceae bacterium]